MGFPRSLNNELNSLERGTSAADTPMSIQDFEELFKYKIKSSCLME